MELITKKLAEALQERIVVEQQSSQLYFALSQWLDFKGYFGASKLFAQYAKEESDHAQKVCKFLLDMDVLPVISALESPDLDVKNLVDVINKSLEHEISVTESYRELAEMTEKHCMVYTFAHDMIKEQVEEVSKMLKWRDRLSIVPEWMVDKEMGA